MHFSISVVTLEDLLTEQIKKKSRQIEIIGKKILNYCIISIIDVFRFISLSLGHLLLLLIACVAKINF